MDYFVDCLPLVNYSVMKKVVKLMQVVLE